MWYVPLTPNEAELAELIAAGHTTAEIARHFGVTERKIEVHIQAIVAKMDFRKRSQIAEWVRTRRPAQGPRSG